MYIIFCWCYSTELFKFAEVVVQHGILNFRKLLPFVVEIELADAFFLLFLSG